MAYQNCLNYKPPFRGVIELPTEIGVERHHYYGSDLVGAPHGLDTLMCDTIEKEDWKLLSEILDQIREEYNHALFWALGKWRDRRNYMTEEAIAAEDHQKFVEEERHRAEYNKSYDDLYVAALKSLGIYKEGMVLEKRPWRKKEPDRPMQWQIDQWERGRLRQENAEKKREEAAKKRAN
jgi:hypothetical protein